jgi:murein DD-endopeptidase MepM/ murein hydrolase activator NlpD
LPFDAPLADSVPTRRSSRLTVTPVPAPAETVSASRADARRRIVEALDEPATQLSRRDRRAAAAASISTPGQPTVVAPVISEPTDEQIDAFEAAARLFSFTGETPVQRATPVAEPAPESAAPSAQPASRLVSSRSRAARGASFKRITAASFSVGVMGIVGLLTVGMTTPADAVARVDGADLSTSLVAAGDVAPTDDEIQAYVAPGTVQNAAIDRPETYSTVTMAQIAADSGIANFSNFFVNDPNSPIQWPFAVGVPISYGFGMRDGTMHEGVDFTPGEGAPIQAIADGVVRESTDSGGAFGVHIVIDHIVDGELVSSSYSHMLYGSREVEVGDHVTVGTIVGHTGNTGRSFGAHTHVEILANGTTPIDPIPWLREHAGG